MSRCTTISGPAHGSASAEGVGHGDRYRFRLDGGEALADPASGWQPEGVDGPSAVVDTRRFRWTDDGWRGVELATTVLYELHLGTFTPHGTFDAAIGQLERLARLGVTTIELMPVNAFPGRRNWGYDGVFPSAVQDSYGGPDGLARFVDAAHGAGLAVVARRRVQPPRSRGRGASQVWAVLQRQVPHAVGGRAQRVGGRQRRRPPHVHRERDAAGSRTSTSTASGSTPSTRSTTRRPCRSSSSSSRRCAPPACPTAARCSRSPRARPTTRPSCVRRRSEASAPTRPGTTTCTMPCGWR